MGHSGETQRAARAARAAIAGLAALALGAAAPVRAQTDAGAGADSGGAVPHHLEIPVPLTPPRRLDTQAQALRDALYVEVNRARKAAGAEPVMRDTGFEDVAGRHADDMAARGYMAHQTPEGLTPRDRLTARFPDYIGVLGENLALRSHRPDETAAQAALATVEAWLDSAPHRRNMLDPRHTHAGLAAASGPLAVYVVMLLGSESSLAAPPPPEGETPLGASLPGTGPDDGPEAGPDESPEREAAPGPARPGA